MSQGRSQPGQHDGTDRRFSVAACEVQPLAAVARASGVRLEDLLGELGLPTDMLAEGSVASFSLGDYFRLLERVSTAIQDETCHLSNRPLLPGSTRFAWSSVADAGDLGEAMKRVALAYNMLHGGHYNHVELRDDSIAYIIDDRAFPYSDQLGLSYIQFTMECVLVFLHGTLMRIAGEPLQHHLRKVHSRRPRPEHSRGPLDFLGAAVRWSAPCYALVYDLHAAFMPIRASATALPSEDAVYREIIELLETGGDAGAATPSCADRVAKRLRLGMTGQSRVAADLAMSVATLRRRLNGEGTSFRALRHRVLADMAKTLLGQGMRSAEVADRLGYADVRSFTRAFKHATGITPGAFNSPVR